MITKSGHDSSSGCGTHAVVGLDDVTMQFDPHVNEVNVVRAPERAVEDEVVREVEGMVPVSRITYQEVRCNA